MYGASLSLCSSTRIIINSYIDYNSYNLQALLDEDQSTSLNSALEEALWVDTDKYYKVLRSEICTIRYQIRKLLLY